MPTPLQKQQAVNLIRSSIQALIAEDRNIFSQRLIEPLRIPLRNHRLNRRLHETTINHRLAFHLETRIRQIPYLANHSVDLEYNRYYLDPKIVVVNGEETAIRPDILIHTRTNRNINFYHYLAVEAKKGRITNHDIDKIVALLQDQLYQYLFGLTVSYCFVPNHVSCWWSSYAFTYQCANTGSKSLTISMKEFNHREDWFYEGQISSKLVSYLRDNGYEILKDNSANINVCGEDIIASKDGIKEVIEVKGYPSEFYTSGEKKGQKKPTKPKLQAKHWFSECILSSLINYRKHKGNAEYSVAMAFPLHSRYLELISIVEDFFTDFNVSLKVYSIDSDGEVTVRNLNRNVR
jgi:Holliday junction resolvase-like predicted endonuclease